MKKLITYFRPFRSIDGQNSGRVPAGLILLVLLLGSQWAVAQNIVYPPESGVVNMLTDARYLLRPNDDSPAAADYNSDKIQRAIVAASGNRSGRVSQVLYFPDGTYYINKKLTLGTTYKPGTDSRELTIQGQSREGTVIRLVDASPGFDGATAAVTPMLVFFEPANSSTVNFPGSEDSPRVDDKATFNNNAMGNYVKNITFNTGANNPNAVAIDFISNNYGGMSDVVIKSGDAQRRGKIGLKMDVKLGGIGYLKNVRVEGFDYGIRVAIYITDYIFEDIELEGQRVAGLVNQDKPMQIRRLTSRNAVPAIINTETVNPATPGVGSIVVLDSRLEYTGDPNLPVPAINNQEGSLFARNLIIDYPIRILDRGVDRSVELPDGGEFSAKGVFSIDGPATGKSMNLPIKDAPVIPWDQDFSDWVVVDPTANGDDDDADLINAAIASGKSTVCVRYGTITVNKTIKFPDGHNVKRFLVLGQLKVGSTSLTTNDGVFDPAVKQPVIEVGTGSNDALVIEGIKTTNGKYFQYVQNNSTKTLILRHNAFYGSNRVYRNKYSATHKPGTLFIEDVASLAENPYGITQPGPAYLFDHQEVFARSFNPENANPHMLNQGGKVVILGFKTEGEGTPFATSQGGFTEILGGEVNGVFRGVAVNGMYPKQHQEIINNDRSSVSIIATERGRFDDAVRDTIVAETRGGVTKYLLKGIMPQTSKAGDFALSTDISLYISYAPANTAPESVANASQTATIGIPFSYTVNAFSDIETPDELTYRVSGLPGGLTFTPASQLISGTVNTTAGSPYSITVTATDPGGLSGSTSFDLFVASSPNQPPVPGTLTDQTTTAGTTGFSYTIPVFSDPDISDSLAYTASGLPVGLAFNPDTRTVSGTPNFAGVSSVTITATDPGDLSASGTFTITVAAAPAVTPEMSVTGVAISQVFGGGNGSTYRYDFVELFNQTNSPISIEGWSIQAAAGAGNFTTTVVGLTGSIAPGSYYLVQLAGGSGASRPIVTPDLINNALDVASANGKLALVNSLVGLGCSGAGNPCTAADLSRIVDLVGYGNTNFSEGNTRAPGLSNARAAFRKSNGCTDTNDNQADFDPTSATPAPRNSVSPINLCDSPAPLTLSFSASPTTILTTATTTLSASVSGGTAPYTYSFSGPGTIVPSGSTAMVSGLPAGVQTFTVLVRDATMPVSQTTTATVSVTVTSPPLPATLRVLYQNADNDPTNNVIRPTLQLLNEGVSPVSFGAITLRYWLTVEDFAQMTNLAIYYAQIGGSKIRMKYVSLDQPRQGALGYVEYSFDASAGSLPAGANSGPIQSGIAKQNYTAFNEVDDYSYATNQALAANANITAYLDGQLVWGTEPTPIDLRQSVKAYSQSRSNGTNSISTFLRIDNDGNVPLDYKDLSVRYWFTVEGTQSLNYWIDYTPLGNSKVVGQFVRLPAPLTGADTYFQVTFDAALGTLSPISSTGNIQYRLAKTDCSNFVESNGFSYKATVNQYVENDHITIYYQGNLVYGVEPTTPSGARLSAELAEEAEIVAYPNPATSSVTLRLGALSGPVEVTLYGLGGQVVHQVKTQLNTPVSVGHLPAGPYVLKAQTDQRTYYIKMVKQ